MGKLLVRCPMECHGAVPRKPVRQKAYFGLERSPQDHGGVPQRGVPKGGPRTLKWGRRIEKEAVRRGK